MWNNLQCEIFDFDKIISENRATRKTSKVNIGKQRSNKVCFRLKTVAVPYINAFYALISYALRSMPHT